RATALRRITPFVSVLFGWLFLAEAVSGWSALGLAFISVSFSLLYIDDRKKLAQVFEGLDLPGGCLTLLVGASKLAISGNVGARINPASLRQAQALGWALL